MKPLSAQKIYAELYDLRVPDWDGEVKFYRELIEHSPLKHRGVLEIACGTGRVAVQLAQAGIEMTGLDISPELLDIARAKSSHMANVQWVRGDLQTFELGRKFGFVISPGHSFQYMTTPDAQVQCLEQIKRHLVPDGCAVIHLDHQDFGWLAGLSEQTAPVYEQGSVLTHPTTHQKFRPSFAWEFEPATQTATVTTMWQELDDSGRVISVLEMEPSRLHCIFPFEMEHLLKRVGFSVTAVYGDFMKSELTRASGQMIWLAKNDAG